MAKTIAELQRAMAQAMDHEEYELAAKLRDQIAALTPGSGIRIQQPGQMGLGTDTQAVRAPKGWKPPPKPNLMTRNTKPRGGRK
ncbi:UvrB/UvrC motif-containing protein [Phenylobacterium sp.]|uniref:UvrB/UvrC motif-containing protein n=1 Tax=Phenylobacterium sp. TaxID=1871053 RepID=UPI00286DB8AB|nr:UvrB/UvrC motif-containing protein [Phenylobacterium sp.]